ncbi:MAG TPA: zinc transporter ZupT [Prolixibacteraceae bacterium]|nr:zinc transporter ZupT [Prolixibacteraceae bacterium]HPR59424.1 zinc transporter ZupT [Prolixibacteraceae bacterium]
MGENFLIAFLLTLFAGLSTGIGSALAFFTKTTNTKLLSYILGLSAGVMIYVSFVEIFPSAMDEFMNKFTEKKAILLTIVSFFGGMLIITLIDKFIPSAENPHEVRTVEDMGNPTKEKNYKKLHRMGIMTAIAVAIHNFPEGIATFMSALNDPTVGIAIAVAIAIHNIPEGIAISVPLYFATGNRRKAFIYSFLSGIAEPVGAFLAYVLLMPFLTHHNSGVVLGIILAAVAGIMVFISLDELLPTAEEYGEHHISIYGVVSGMLIMAFSLLLLA